MKNALIFTFFLLQYFTGSAQGTSETDQKFNWAIHTMDRWLIEGQPVCDVCLTPEKLAEMDINLDSASLAYFNGRNMVNMSDIFDALKILETITDIESTIHLNLGTFGVSCNDCSGYESDRKRWIDWYNTNGSTLEEWKVALLKDLPKTR